MHEERFVVIGALLYALLAHGITRSALEQPVLWFVAYVAAWFRLLRNWNDFGGHALVMISMLHQQSLLGIALVLLMAVNNKS
jgi:hypothetical protein